MFEGSCGLIRCLCPTFILLALFYIFLRLVIEPNVDERIFSSVEFYQIKSKPEYPELCVRDIIGFYNTSLGLKGWLLWRKEQGGLK